MVCHVLTDMTAAEINEKERITIMQQPLNVPANRHADADINPGAGDAASYANRQNDILATHIQAQHDD